MTVKTILSRSIIILIISVIYPVFVYGQQPVSYDLFTLAEKQGFQVFNREVKSFSEGSDKGAFLTEAENYGVAWINNLVFSNGTIEFELKGKDVSQRSFLGIAFHGENETTFDAIYFRPFNFQPTDPVRKTRAVQYVSLPDNDWPKLRAEYEGKYESAVIPATNPNKWFHVTIKVDYPKVQVYINGEKEPCLSIEQLSSRKTGKLGLWVGNNSDGYFKNLVIRD